MNGGQFKDPLALKEDLSLRISSYCLKLSELKSHFGDRSSPRGWANVPGVLFYLAFDFEPLIPQIYPSYLVFSILHLPKYYLTWAALIYGEVGHHV